MGHHIRGTSSVRDARIGRGVVASGNPESPSVINRECRLDTALFSHLVDVETEPVALLLRCIEELRSSE